MTDRLLLPTDMSLGVDRAIEHAIDAAQRYDAEPHVLYVADAEAYSSHPGDAYVHEFEGLNHVPEQASRDTVESITNQAIDAGIETVSKVRHGVPHEEILAYGDEADVDLNRRRLEEPTGRIPTIARRCSKIRRVFEPTRTRCVLMTSPSASSE